MNSVKERASLAETIHSIVHYLRGSNLLLFLSTLWILLLLSAWSVRQAFLADFSFQGLWVADYWTISNHASWLSLAAEVSRGNLFPINPFLGQGDMGVGFFPYLALWFTGLLISLFGLNGALLVSSTLLPTLSYLFMVLIYRHYVSWRWSISLAALGILGISAAPFHEFLVAIMMGTGWTTLGVLNLPDATGLPFPSVSLLSFVVLFYLTVQRTYISRRRMTILSIAWGLQSQVHLLNLIVGVPFWLGLLALTLWRSHRGGALKQSREWFIQTVIVGMLCLPMLISFWGQDSTVVTDGISSLVGSVDYAETFDSYFFFAYLFLPLAMLFAAFWVFRIDPYELLFKFLPVWVMMAVELLLVLVWNLFGIGVPENLLLSRLGMFFLHLFYFIPAIYCVHRSSMIYHVGIESVPFAKKVRSLMQWFFRDASLVYLPIFAILITGYSLASSEKSYQNFQKGGFSSSLENRKVFDLLLNGMQEGDVLIAPTNSINLSLSTVGRFGSLWDNRIVSRNGMEEMIARFALYARLMGWSKSQYRSFMSPVNPPFNQTDQMYDLSTSEAIPGLGYWLVFTNRKMGSEELNGHLSSVDRAYESMSVEKLKEYGVKRMILIDETGFIDKMPSKKIGQYMVIDSTNNKEN